MKSSKYIKLNTTYGARCIQNQLNNVNKKRMAIARKLLFWKFLKASMAGLITLLFFSLQSSEGGGDGDSRDSCADPCQFLPFPKTKI